MGVMLKYNIKGSNFFFWKVIKQKQKKCADLNFISFSLVCPCECAVWKSKRVQLNVFQ